MLSDEFEKRLIELEKTQSEELYTVIKKELDWLLSSIDDKMKCDNCKLKDNDCTSQVVSMSKLKNIFYSKVDSCSMFDEKE